MQWIKFLSIHKTPHYIYKLSQYDHLIITNVHSNTDKNIIILYGITCVIKTFSNQEIIPVAILTKNNIFTNNNKDHTIYYKIIALELTYVITFNKTTNQDRLNIIEYYIKTLEKYENMNQIMSQRQAKARIFQLILSICLQFGKVNKNTITMPFKLSKQCISTMTGLSEHTVSKIISKLHNKDILKKDQKTISIKNLLNINLK